MERRNKLVELADRYGVPIVEDDPYGQLRFEGEHLPPVVVLDGQLQRQSRCLLHWQCDLPEHLFQDPGARDPPGLGDRPAEVIRKLVMAKQGCDLHTPTFNQIVAYEVAGVVS